MNWLRSVVLLFSLASVGAQLVAAQLPVIAPSLDDPAVIAPPPPPPPPESPEILVDPVVDDEPAEEAPTAEEESDDEEADDAEEEPTVLTSGAEDSYKRRLLTRADSDDDDDSRGHLHRGRHLGHSHKHRDGQRQPKGRSNRRNRRHSDDDDDDDYNRRPRGRRSHKHRSSSDDDDDTPTTTTTLRRRRPSKERNPGDLRDLIGLPCTDRYSKGKCSYLAAQGLCSSNVSSHVNKAWRSCRRSCGLCKTVVPDCLPGYRFNLAFKKCVDIDECAEKSAVCAANAQCVNKDGCYACRCKDGFVGNGKTSCQVHCADVSPKCAKHSSKCQSPSARMALSKLCPVTCGTCKTRCPDGFKVAKDGKSCVNVNRCLENKARCPAHSTCVDTKRGYRCTCDYGYAYNIITRTCVEHCKDVATDCASRSSQCGTGTSLLQAWMGTHCPATCKACGKSPCPRGYQRDANGQCVDVDECASAELNYCAANANCVNTAGSYLCRCQVGYQGNALVKCTTDRCFDLHHAYRCRAMKTMGICNSRDRYMCAQTCKLCSNDDITACSKGYAAKNGVCLDVDECKALTHRCPSNSRCINARGGYRCKCNQGYSASKATGQWKCVRENVCYVAGDPHIVTYDGQAISYSGLCDTLLTQPDARRRGLLTDFSVVIGTEHRNGDAKTTWVSYVKLAVFDVVITLGRKGQVLVNGEEKAVPYNPRPGVSITISGKGISIILSNGVQVSFDGDQLVKVSVPNAYRRKMTGLCGNLDDIPANDLVTREGLRTPSHAKIGNSYAVPDPTRPCLPATDEDNSGCSKGDLPQVTGRGQCGILRNPKGPFADCVKKVNPSVAFEACVGGVCRNPTDPQTLCRSLLTFADRCQTEGVTVAWRSPSFCPMACGENSAYSPSMSACPATCANPSSEGTCTRMPHEGCACSAGMVRDGNQKCVPVTECGCQLNGVYHPTGDVWYDGTCSYRFTCMEQSTILKVPSTCQNSGTCQTKNGKVGCYCNDPAAGAHCDVDSGNPQVTPNDPEYNPTAPILPPNVVQQTTTTPAPTVPTTPAYVPPHPDGEIADYEYFNAPPPPPLPPKARPLGIESGVIPDKDITASSSTPTDPPTHSRPNSRGAWCPDESDKTPAITYDLGKPMDIHGLGTIGHYKKRCWVKNYNILVSDDGINFTALLDTRQEYATQPRNFVGNSDQNTWTKHCLHGYYGTPVRTRFVRILVLVNNGCTALRVELYGFRDGRDPKLIEVLKRDQWTKSTEGCTCYFDNSTTECACCHYGGCQCPRSNLHQCVKCGYAENCGTPEIKQLDEQMDPWTISPTGCQCFFDQKRFDCACCKREGCPCGRANKNQCVTCGHEEHCGQKPEIFGPSETCVPKTCPSPQEN